MAHWFEELSKNIGDEKIGRRAALRRVAGGIAGTALAGTIPGLALARNKHCLQGGNCTIGFTNCVGNPNTNCYCFTQINGKAVCGCNTFCSQTMPCSSSSQCGKGNTCIILNGCTSCGSSSGVCIAKCQGKNNSSKNCMLGSGHGRTAAH